MSRELQAIMDSGEIDNLLMDSGYSPDADYKISTKKYTDDADDLKATIVAVQTDSLNSYRGISALRTLDATDNVIECTANSFTVTLPTAVGIEGKVYIIKNTGAGSVTVDGDAAETIDGSATQTLAQWDSITLISNNAGWLIIGNV